MFVIIGGWETGRATSPEELRQPWITGLADWIEVLPFPYGTLPHLMARLNGTVDGEKRQGST
ncbi:hypothetical protein [Mesorhizobium sp. LSJC269B00]|uniref:hypothetical protein n=1 Tax=Mesorhizobium sp. LSJC269B00 TaxID=1287326 RepID=UPI00041554E0|nr:hypothetical protein [Mesorhizobium sp. LSJC269B00]